MKNLLLNTTFLAFFLVFIAFSLKNSDANNITDEPDKEIEWLTMEEAVLRNAVDPRLIIVDVYTSWCGWCKKMDKTTFQHPDVAKYVSEKFHAVKLDAESTDAITVDDITYNYVQVGKKGVHELAYALLGNRQSYPSVAVLDKDLSKLTIIQGYMDAQDMDRALRYFGDGYYEKGIKWGIFEKNFKSRIKGGKKR